MARTRARPPEQGPPTKRQQLAVDHRRAHEKAQASRQRCKAHGELLLEKEAEKERLCKAVDDMNEKQRAMLSETMELEKEEKAAAEALVLAEEEEKAALDLELQQNDDQQQNDEQ